MADIVDKATRSRMMSGIRGMNTRPEARIRSLLHRQGLRYRLHVPDLPGKPDIVLPRFHAVVFVNGCFWHGHNCPLFKMPGTRSEFWRIKICHNQKNDQSVIAALRVENWRVAVVWECALKGRDRLDDGVLIKRLARWIRGNTRTFEITGRNV